MESIVFMQLEDSMATFERANGDTIIYPHSLVPQTFSLGDIIIAIVHSEDSIEFLELDAEEMNLRRANIADKKARLKSRARRSTNTA